MSANTETTGADRTKCLEWCGKVYGARGVPFRRSCGFPMYFEHGADFNVAVKDDEPTWCLPACRDARLPPIAAPDFEHQALCRVERGGSCNCVPIAAPAAHIERRKGPIQAAWGCCGLRGACGRTIGNGGPGWRDYQDGKEPALAIGEVFCPDHAPPEPAKPTTPQCDPSCRPGQRCKYCTTDVAKSPPAQEAPKYLEERARCGYVVMSTNREAAIIAVGKHQATCAKCRAQEAPKAAPVCVSCEASYVDRPVPMRVVGLVRHARPICDDCYLQVEARLGDHDYAPYAGPERLPRPRLAADWVEDCPGDVR